MGAAGPISGDAAPRVLARPVRDYRDVDALLLSRVREDPRPYMARSHLAGRAVAELLRRAGIGLDHLRFLHIAGSKGKGSVALFAERLLLGHGDAVGTYTSPHLRRWNERMRIDGAPVDDAVLARALDDLRPHVAALDAAGDELAPTFFDLVTAAALVIFARSACRTVVLEAGLGGRFDATSVVHPSACCITSIELEHTDKLGGTVAQVAWHKAGIVKPGAPVVTGELPLEAQRVVEEQVASVHARELRAGRDWHVRSVPAALGTQSVELHDLAHGRAPERFELPCPGRHMALNAALAVMLVRSAGFETHAAALGECALPGRCQIVRRRPWIIVDAAHTGASLRALEDVLATLPARERRFVVSATSGKECAPLAALVHGADEVVVTRADHLRSAPAAELARRLHELDPTLSLSVIEDPALGLARASDALHGDALLCVCGSVYLAGLALERLGAS